MTDNLENLSKINTHVSVRCPGGFYEFHQKQRHGYDSFLLFTQHLLSSKFASFRKWESCQFGAWYAVARYIAPYFLNENEAFFFPKFPTMAARKWKEQYIIGEHSFTSPIASPHLQMHKRYIRRIRTRDLMINRRTLSPLDYRTVAAEA